MKKLKKPKKPKLPKTVNRPFRRSAKSAEEKFNDALSNVPRITNDTVADHREEVLSSARKYIYPLQHSKHKVVRISLALFALVLVSFFAICCLNLYRFQSTSGFMYDVTRIIPFPVAKTGDHWISYESYLFELRHNMHYYQTQQQANFTSHDGRNQLNRLRRQAMDQVIRDAYVKELAQQHGVSVSNQSVENQVTLLKNENRLGNNDRVFREVLNEFWGWGVADFKRELKQQLLQQAVVTKLDTATNDRAQAALDQLLKGADFAKLAAELSDDPATKTTGGNYPNAITISDRDVPPALTAELFKLRPGETSAIINTGYTLEIIKVVDGGTMSRHAAHLQFTLKDISAYTQPLQDKHPPQQYIRIKT